MSDLEWRKQQAIRLFKENAKGAALTIFRTVVLTVVVYLTVRLLIALHG